jgi:hypothetical protein
MWIKRQVRTPIVMALIGVLVAPCLLTIRAHAAISSSQNPPRFGIAPALPVIADFDGDCRADKSELLSNGFEKNIRVDFADLRSTQLHFTAKVADPGELFAVDIDHDGDVDLVWIASSDQRTDVVWINDGKGKFEVAKDDTPYVTEIDRLRSSDDPAKEFFAAGGSSTHILTVSSPTGWALLTTSTPAAEAKSISAASTLKQQNTDSLYFAYLHKRGPPAHVSSQV